MFSGKLRAAELDVLGRATDPTNHLLRPSRQHRPLGHDDHSSMSAILTGIRRLFARTEPRDDAEPCARAVACYRSGESCRTRAVARTNATCRLQMGSHEPILI